MSNLLDSFDSGEDQAREAGLTVIYSRPNLLLLDLDTEAAYFGFSLGLRSFGQHFHVTGRYEQPSKSGWPHRHVALVTGTKYDVPTRIGLQMYLGSDMARELISLKRFEQGIANPIRLFVAEGPLQQFKPVIEEADYDGLV